MSLAMTEAAPAVGLSRWDYVLRTWRELDVPDGRRAEIIDDNGVVLAAPPSDPHDYIADRVNRALLSTVPDDWGVYQTLGIQLPVVERLYVPDLVVMPESVVLDPSVSPCTAEEAELVVEIVSRSSMDVDRRKKLWGYAHAPVPLYLLIDAWDDMGPSVTLYEQPGNGRYNHATTVEFGEKIGLPEPFGLEIDTSRFPRPDQWPS
ncbi:Uma2 family endonuclease [Nocardiopsis tropica]|uniref:Uma2 family endonuclease n=1 Tax=Nocardiopsis tropica TaxID=109330 RepID=A0ABU7KX55_9ACTN|nr:Uma2 family endonuclease [Nocardiopsis umidischolae]MEE2053859.1 Uma2 family endonuclease [Nocardiopsis umidischolae]